MILDNKKTNSVFSEQYLYWLYDGVCYIFKWEKNALTYAKVVNIHLFINFILMWHFIFFYANKELIIH